MMDIRPIRTEEDYDWALAEIATYFETPPQAGTTDADRFDVLADLIEAYEAKHWPIEPVDPVEAIRHRMDMEGLKQKDLAEILGSAARASEILNRKRALTMDMAYKLHQHWHIPAEVLIRPYRLTAA